MVDYANFIRLEYNCVTKLKRLVMYASHFLNQFENELYICCELRPIIEYKFDVLIQQLKARKRNGGKASWYFVNAFYNFRTNNGNKPHYSLPQYIEFYRLYVISLLISTFVSKEAFYFSFLFSNNLSSIDSCVKSYKYWQDSFWTIL